MESLHGIIVGGGIGGLAAAIALRQAGVRTTVVDRATLLREVGAGITLWGNALTALRKLGLGEELKSIRTVGQGAIRTNRGRILASYTYGDAERWLGGPVSAFHRADLHRLLLHAAGGDKVVHTGKRCIGFEQAGPGVRVHFSDGSPVEGDFLVGADGIQSVIRSGLFGREPPLYSGYTAWRGVTVHSHDELENYWGEYWGRGNRFGLVPLTGSRVYWFFTCNAAEGEMGNVRKKRQCLLETMQSYPAPLQKLVRETPWDSILWNDIYDRAPLKTWHRGSVALLGDAAHATTPNLGQGACQALEDAVVLGREMGRMLNHTGTDEAWATTPGARGIEAALADYERIRLPRANSVIRDSRLIGAVGQWENPLAVWVRNTVLSAMPKRSFLERIAKYSDYDV